MTIAPSSEWRLAGVGGVELFARSWLPSAEPKDVLVIAHGYAEHGGRYGNIVDRLVPLGFAVHAIDHRGHGRSGGPRAFVDAMMNIQADFDGFVDAVRARHGGVRLKLLGHSMGGSIAFGYALDHADKLSGLILSAPAIGGRVPAVQRTLLRLVAAVSPRTGVLELPPETISRDPRVVSDYIADPLVTKGKIAARTAAELLGAARSYLARAPRMTLPVLIQHGSADIPVPVADNTAFYEAIGSTDKTVRLYEGAYHEIYNEADHGTVLDDLTEWLDRHRAPQA